MAGDVETHLFVGGYAHGRELKIDAGVFAWVVLCPSGRSLYWRYSLSGDDAGQGRGEQPLGTEIMVWEGVLHPRLVREPDDPIWPQTPHSRIDT